MSKKTCYILATCMFLLFGILIALLLTVDVTNSGVKGSNIGLSGINVPMRDIIGTSRLFYNISKIIGAIGVGLCAFLCAMLGFRVLRKKSLKALNKKEYALIGLYFVTAIFYVAFDKIVINYRPFIKWDESGPESSFPSTHSLMAIVIFAGLAHATSDYIKNELTLKIIQMACVIMALLVIIGRIFSGVHWITDIIGGIILGIGLVCIYLGIVTDKDNPSETDEQF